MGVQLNTLLLNEAEWVRKNYEQHRDWPEMIKWVFVESADVAYAEANPGAVTSDGLSTDGTTEMLDEIAAKDPRVIVIHFGWSKHPEKEKGKVAARNRYWEIAEDTKPEFMIQVDQDEFYTRRDQAAMLELFRRPDQREHDCWTLPKREIWRPPSVADRPLLESEVVGGFWGIPCCHWFRWGPGVGHRDCHNTPQRPDGSYVNDRLKQLHDREWIPAEVAGQREFTLPAMLHLGYAAAAPTRRAKAAYYAGRGEAEDRQRRWYVESRAVWFDWKPGDALPRGAQVIPYDGPVPEIFEVK